MTITFDGCKTPEAKAAEIAQATTVLSDRDCNPKAKRTAAAEQLAHQWTEIKTAQTPK